MQKIIVLALMFITAQLGAQQNMQRPVISKITATWCTNCGSWGWNFMEALLEEFSDGRAVVLAVHHSGDLENPTSDALAKNFGNSYQPEFFVNNSNVNALSSTWPNKLEEIKSSVAEVNGEMAPFDIEINAFKEASQPVVHADVTVRPNITMADEDYYLAAYLVEDNLVHFQASQGNDAVHHKVVRASMTSDVFGEMIFASGQSIPGNPVERSYSINSLDATGNDNHILQDLDVVVMVYQKVNDKYVIANAHIFEDAAVTTSTENITFEESPKFVFNGQQGILTIRPSTSIGNATYEVIEASGRLKFKNRVQLETGQMTTIAFPASHLPSGTYFLRITGDNKAYTHKFVR